jgi:hypothetical protein
MEEERIKLINQLQKMGVSHICGKNPYTAPINELKVLVDWIEKRNNKTN